MSELMVKGIQKFIHETENLFEPAQIMITNQEIVVEMKLLRVVPVGWLIFDGIEFWGINDNLP